MRFNTLQYILHSFLLFSIVATVNAQDSSSIRVTVKSSVSCEISGNENRVTIDDSTVTSSDSTIGAVIKSVDSRIARLEAKLSFAKVNFGRRKVRSLKNKIFKYQIFKSDILACKENRPLSSSRFSNCNELDNIYKSETVSTRIFNGDTCRTSSTPVVLLELIDFRGTTFATCSGTVISPNTVLTAGHCVSDGVVKIAINVGGVRIAASHFEAHKKHDTSKSGFERYDLGIILASSTIPVAPAILEKTEYTPKIGEVALIAGYGLDEFGSSEILNVAKAQVYEVRKKSLKTFFSNTEQFGNTCSGDSGGPIFINRKGKWHLAGVTSNGKRLDCGVGDIAGYVNIQSKSSLSFINKFLQ